MQKQSKGNIWGSSFVKGLLLAVAFGVIFYGGMQIGSGAWSLSIASFSNKPIEENKDLPNKLDYSSVDKVYKDLKQKFDGELDEVALIEGMKKGMVDAAGDPYTSYLDAEQTISFNESLNGTFEGIGAELSKEENVIIVVTPLSGSPAEAAGLRAQDIIVTIDGQDATGISVEEAVKRIRGEKGTDVTLGVIRSNEQLDITITRSTIELASVKTEYLENGTIGYIELSMFSGDTVELVNDAVKEFKERGVKGVILDVRNNPGGLLNASVDVSEVWLESGDLILEEKRGGITVESYKTSSKGILAGMPTVVLINEGSASASEITAGALKDNDAATLVGVTSFGKGSVQEPKQYADGSLLKVTVAKWYTPNGQNINESGIEPDVKVERTNEDYKNKVDPQKTKAIEILTSN